MYYRIGGTAVESSDPLNVVLRNITFETKFLTIPFSFIIGCNYPEANLFNNFLVENFELNYTATVLPVHITTVIFYSGPGNLTAKGLKLNSAMNDLKSTGQTLYFYANAA